MRLHALLVRLTLREAVAEELMQELTMKLADSQGFADAARPAAYARRTAVNLAATWRRREKPHGAGAELIEQLPIPGPTPLDRLMRQEKLERLLDELAAMGEQDQWLLTRRYLEGCSYSDLAEEMACTPHQARGVCHKAIGRLRRRMEEKATAADRRQER